MLNRTAKSVLVLFGVALMVAFFAWVDHNRGGPATKLSRCNLALARAEFPSADVLLIGSSRSGVAFDPVAIQDVLTRESDRDVTVDRIAIGNITLRVADALLKTYLDRRGAPGIVVLETTFMTPRTVERLAPIARGKPSEHILLTRDVNLMTFSQLIAQPAVAMPYSEPESTIVLWQVKLRGAISRMGALTYEFAKAPFDTWSVNKCEKLDFTREPFWSEDFSFAYDDHSIGGPLSDSILELTREVEILSRENALLDWQLEQPSGRTYPFDFDEAYRQGEMVYFQEMVRSAQTSGASVVVLPMTLYSYEIDPADLVVLKKTLPQQVEVIDIYSDVGVDSESLWYDDAHIQKSPTGALTSALLSAHLLSILNESTEHD